ncbi:MAG: M14 family metallopeptidase [Eubacteriales bacterium]|nr:M14 family metallopeptidase [Eubacteriales bacterium]
MIKTVASSTLPVDERLEIRKNRILPLRPAKKSKIFSVVTGTHGDELEGQYVCHRLNEILNANREKLTGIVDIYPALNPLGIDTITRGIPMFDLDMNRIFPGDVNGTMAEYLAAGIMEELSKSDFCIDIHASNIYLREIPQVRISEDTAEELLPYAKELNVDFIWVHGAATVLKSTLAHSLNSVGVPTLVVEMGVGMRITESYGEQLVEGILHLMGRLGIWQGETKEVRQPHLSDNPEEIIFVNAPASGIFLQETSHGESVCCGERIGRIVNPLDGKVLAELRSECDGLLFTIREYPVVGEGSLIARILKTGEGKK